MDYMLFPAVLCLMVVTLRIHGVSGESYSSIVSMQNMLKNQRIMLAQMETYLHQEYDRLNALRRLLDKKRQAVEAFDDFPEEFLEAIAHPVTAYRLIKDWSRLYDRIHDDSVRKAFIEESKDNMPDKDDLDGALRAILRLQLVYNLTADDISKGNIRGHTSKAPIGGRDFYRLGKKAMENARMIPHAIEWLEKAFESHPVKKERSAILRDLSQAQQLLENLQKREELKAAHEKDPANQAKRIDYYQADRDVNYLREHDYRSRDDFEYLCRRKTPGIVNPKKELWCQYQSQTKSYVQYKMEVMSKDPWVVVYYDVLTDRESKYIRDISAPNLDRAKFDNSASEIRVCKLTWLFNSQKPSFVNQLNGRVAEITGLGTGDGPPPQAEAFQVVNYGLGGQYEPHHDFLGENSISNGPAHLMNSGDRLATFMFYVSDVTEGGATVFPLLDLYVPPIKNSAVFWYNAHRNGTNDVRTIHAGCPVLVGSKWVANKWIRHAGQSMTRPCGSTEWSTELEMMAT